MNWTYASSIVIWLSIPIWTWLIWTARKDRKKARKILHNAEALFDPDAIARIAIQREGGRLNAEVYIRSDRDYPSVAGALRNISYQIEDKAS